MGKADTRLSTFLVSRKRDVAIDKATVCHLQDDLTFERVMMRR